MKTALYLITAALFAISTADGGILVSLDNPSQSGALDNPDQTGNPGYDFVFSGRIVNNGSETVYLDADSLIFNNNGDNLNFTVNDDFGNVPISLDPNQTSDDIELFDIMISPSFTAAFGPYTGSYSLLGDPDGSQSPEQVNEPVSFSVDVETVAPEPGSIWLGAGATIALLVGKARHLRSRVGCCRHAAEDSVPSEI